MDGLAVWQVRNSTVEVRRGDEFSVTCVVTSLTPIDVIRVELQRTAHRRGDVETQLTGDTTAGTEAAFTLTRVRVRVRLRVTLNNASDYRTNGHYRTPNTNHNPSPLVR